MSYVALFRRSVRLSCDACATARRREDEERRGEENEYLYFAGRCRYWMGEMKLTADWPWSISCKAVQPVPGATCHFAEGQEMKKLERLGK